MKKSPKIIFFGNERLATGVTTTAPTLQALLDNGYEVAAVVVNNETAVSRSGRQVEVAALAESRGIPVLILSKLRDNIVQLRDYGADAGVLVAYGKIVPQEVIDIFPAGIVNIHPSALPKHRGPTPLESVLLAGETETAVSLMKLVKAMDAGPVYAQRTFKLPGKISKQDMANELLGIGSKMLVQHLPAIIDGSLEPEPQEDSAATYDQLINKTDGAVDWTKPAKRLEREIRAYADWPKSNAMIGNHQVILRDSDVVNTSGKPGEFSATKKELIVFCGEGALSIRRLQPLNKKEMPVEAFLAGYPL